MGTRQRKQKIGLIQKRIILWISFVFVVFISWAASFQLDEVAIGEGRVIPSSQMQEIQSVQGGRVIELLAKEGDLVEEGQLLAILDTTTLQAELEEIQSRLKNDSAQQFLLNALLSDKATLELPETFKGNPDLVREKTQFFEEIRATQEQAVKDLNAEKDLLLEERAIFERASRLGSSTEIERLRLEQKIAAVYTRLNKQKTSYRSDLRAQLDEINRDVQQLNIRSIAQQELLLGAELRSPKRGVVQEVLISTAGGGVLTPNGTVMEIVPIEGRLLVEARFSPRDVAFIYSNQEARIKVSAYDFAIYGDLSAKVLRVSPNSFQDEINSGQYFFSVTLEADRTYFETPSGKQLPITPGMVTTVEILTGEHSILEYLLKPLRRGSQALRERQEMLPNGVIIPNKNDLVAYKAQCFPFSVFSQPFLRCILALE